jgi:hypothetical protein
LTAFLGVVLMPDTFNIWRQHTERALAAMDQSDFPRPPKPRDPNAPQDPRPGPIFPRPGALVMARGEILSNRVAPAALPKPAEAAPAVTAAKEENPMMPTPTPTPTTSKREQRRDGPPGPGERQIHILAGGTFDLGKGETARCDDYINLPTDQAEMFLKRGVANPVDVPPAPASEPATVEGVFDAKIDVPFGKGPGE